MGWPMILVVWLAGYALTVFPLARWMIKNGSVGPGDTADQVMACVLAVLIALFWPLILAGWFVYRRVVKQPVKPDKP